MTGRKLNLWMGECHVHAGIAPHELEATAAARPGAELLVHPECGCTTSTMFYGTSNPKLNVYIRSTEGMIKHAEKSAAKEFIVATENGILHRLKKEVPGKTFYPASEGAVCQYMKMITLEKVQRSLEEDVFHVTVPPDIARRARIAIDRMMAIPADPTNAFRPGE
jgi:quinolinate synthase